MSLSTHLDLPSGDSFSWKAFEENSKDYLQRFQDSEGQTQENYRKTLEEKVLPFLRAQAGLVEKSSIAKDLPKARYTLTNLSLNSDLRVQQKAMDLLLEVLYHDPFDLTQPNLAYQLLNCEELFRNSLEIVQFQKLPVALQIQKLTVYGTLIATVLGYYALGHLGAVSTEIKLAMTNTSKVLVGLNTHNNPQLDFALAFTLEGIKRLQDNKNAFDKTIECLGPLLRMAGAIYRTEIGEALQDFSAFVTAFSHNVSYKQGWYDSVLSLHHIARKAEKEPMQLLNLQAWLLVKDKKKVPYPGLRKIQKQIQGDENDWKFFCGAASILAEIAQAEIGKTSMQEKSSSKGNSKDPIPFAHYALLGTKGPMENALPGLFSFYDLEVFQKSWQLRYLVVQLTASFWKSPDPKIRQEASEKIDALLKTEKDEKVRSLLQKEKLSEHQRKSEGLELEKLEATKQITQKKQTQERLREVILTVKEKSQDQRAQQVRLEAQVKKIKEENLQKETNLSEKQAILADRKNALSQATDPSQEKRLRSEITSLTNQIEKLAKERQKIEEKYQEADAQNKELSMQIEQQKEELRKKEEELRQDQTFLHLKEKELQSLEASLKENQRQSEREIALSRQKLSQEQSALKKLQEELATGQKALEQAQKHLESQEKAMDQRQYHLNQEKMELQGKEKVIQAREQELARKEAKLLDLEKEFHTVKTPQLMAKLEEFRQDLRKQKEELQIEARTLEQQKEQMQQKEDLFTQELLLQKQQLQKQAEELEEKQKALQAKEWEAEIDQLSLQSTQESLTRRQEELKRAEASSRSLEQELHRREKELRTKELLLEEREKALIAGQTDLPALPKDPSRLDLSDEKGLTDAALLHHLTNPAALETVYLPKGATVTSKGLVAFLEKTPALRKFSLKKYSEISEELVQVILQCPKLENLDLTGSVLREKALTLFSQGKARIKKLNLTQCHLPKGEIPESALKALLGLPYLEKLILPSGQVVHKEAFMSYSAPKTELVPKGEPVSRKTSAAPPVLDIHCGDFIEKGNEYLEKRQFDKARQEYQMALHLDPASVEAYQGLGAAYYQENDFQQALAAYEKALKLKPQEGHLQETVRKLQHMASFSPPPQEQLTPGSTPKKGSLSSMDSPHFAGRGSTEVFGYSTPTYLPGGYLPPGYPPAQPVYYPMHQGQIGGPGYPPQTHIEDPLLREKDFYIQDLERQIKEKRYKKGVSQIIERKHQEKDLYIRDLEKELGLVPQEETSLRQLPRAVSPQLSQEGKESSARGSVSELMSGGSRLSWAPPPGGIFSPSPFSGSMPTTPSTGVSPASSTRGSSASQAPVLRAPKKKEPPSAAPLPPLDKNLLIQKKLQNPQALFSLEDSITLLTQCIQYGKIEAEKARGKNAVIFIGNTGAGKSTTVNYLCGCTMESKNPKELGIKGLGKVIVVKQPQEGGKLAEVMPIGHTKESKTFMPQIETHDQITYCDCPGFLDNRGAEINIANAVNIKHTIAQAKSAVVIMLINYNSLLAERGRGLTEMLKICCNLFGKAENLIKHKDSLLIGITNAELTLELEELKEWIAEDATELMQTLADRIFIFDPLDRPLQGGWKRAEFLRQIQQLKPITENARIFSTVLTDEDENKLIQISEQIGQKISKALSAKDFPQASSLFHRLQELQLIEHITIDRLLSSTQKKIHRHLEDEILEFRNHCHFERFDEAEKLLLELEDAATYFDEDIEHFVQNSNLHQYYQDSQDKAAESKRKEKHYQDQIFDAQQQIQGIVALLEEQKQFTEQALIRQQKEFMRAMQEAGEAMKRTSTEYEDMKEFLQKEMKERISQKEAELRATQGEGLEKKLHQEKAKLQQEYQSKLQDLEKDHKRVLDEQKALKEKAQKDLEREKAELQRKLQELEKTKQEKLSEQKKFTS